MLALRFNTSSLDDIYSLSAVADQLAADGAGRRAWTPAIEVQESADTIQMVVDLPGVNPQDVSIVVENGVLTIAGEKRPLDRNDENTALRYTERWYGKFERTLTLPTSADPDGVEAAYHDGVLTIQLRKSERAKARRVQIATGAAQAPQLGASRK